jgi:CheY-like chemotaxis protein
LLGFYNSNYQSELNNLNEEIEKVTTQLDKKGKNIKIYYSEDIKGIRTNVAADLEALGFKVISFETAEELIDRLTLYKDSKDFPDIVLLDNLYGWDKELLELIKYNPSIRYIPTLGKETTEVIRKHYKELPVYVLTGYISNKEKNLIRDQGANGVFNKTVKLPLELLEELLRQTKNIFADYSTNDKQSPGEQTIVSIIKDLPIDSLFTETHSLTPSELEIPEEMEKIKNHEQLKQYFVAQLEKIAKEDNNAPIDLLRYAGDISLNDLNEAKKDINWRLFYIEKMLEGCKNSSKSYRSQLALGYLLKLYAQKHSDEIIKLENQVFISNRHTKENANFKLYMDYMFGNLDKFISSKKSIEEIHSNALDYANAISDMNIRNKVIAKLINTMHGYDKIAFFNITPEKAEQDFVEAFTLEGIDPEKIGEADD